MTIDFGWFPPTMGDPEMVGPPTREATIDYLTPCAKTAEDARPAEKLRARVETVAAATLALARAAAG
jgi:hypothetical protein